MADQSNAASLAEVLSERQHLFNVTFRMLGTVADAEDAVQETLTRWLRLTDTERAAIRSPRAWLTRVAGNVSLDVLGSARHRREQYVGEWLPEPLPGNSLSKASWTIDPLDRVTIDDSVTMALLIVLESLTPAERVAFVLHDVFAMAFDEIAVIVGRSPQACRKLASSARAHVAARRSRQASREQHSAVVAQFWSACETGDLTELLRILDPDVVALVDGGGVVKAALKPMTGAISVARFLLGSLSKHEESEVGLETVSGQTGLVFRHAGAVVSAVSFDVTDDRVTDIWLVLSPLKLSRWNPPLT